MTGRYARLHVTGGLFHVISRFHDREFLMDRVEGARERYLNCLENALAGSDSRLLAYCLMSSHVHLVVQLGTQPLGRLTRSVNNAWVKWLNLKAKRVGTAMAGRPRSVLCDSDTYALELVRYVHNNPVRAGLVAGAGDSSWSSHGAYLGMEEPPDWLDIEPLLTRLAGDVVDARAAFSEYVNSGRGEPRRVEFSGEVSREMAGRIRSLVRGPVEISYPVLGPDEFILRVFGEQVRANEDGARFSNVDIGALDVLRAVCDETGVEGEMVLGRSRCADAVRCRKLTSWVWCERLGRSQATVADMFGLQPNAVSQMLKRMMASASGVESDAIMSIVRRLRRRLIQLLEERQSDEGSRRDAREAQVFVLQRLREVEERLFGKQVFGD